nr:integrase, catalytic region, zinc finger, CCHC-type, peptidase aspartic, catalytic [Tanacetum cinerariifolium]
MYVANTSDEARCLALEAELATLRDKSHQENQGELIKHFSKLEVDHLNLQLKYQNLKDSIRNNPPTPDKDTPDFDSVFVIGKMQASFQGKDNAIRQLKKQLSKLQLTSNDIERIVKVRTTDSQLTKVTDPVTNLQAQNDLFKAENDKVNQHYKQLYDSIKITRAKHIEQVTKLIAKNVTLKTSVSKAKVQPPVLTRKKHAIDVEPIVLRLRNNRDAHLYYLRHVKESVEKICDIVEGAGSDTRPPMLDRTDFASWQQWIRLYCRGKDNGVKILKSINEGPYKLVTFRETLAESTEGTPQFGPERPRVYSNLILKRKIGTMPIFGPPIYCSKGCQKTYTPSSITTPTRKTFRIMSKCSLMGLN